MSDKQAAPGAGLYPYPDPDMRLEGDVRAALKRALGLRDEDFDRISPEMRHLLGVRRHLGNTWLDDFEVVLEITSNGRCGCGVAPGQVVVFDMRHRVKPEKSTAPLCMHLLAPVLAIFYMTFDRAADGLNPVTSIWRFFDCLDTGEDLGREKARGGRSRIITSWCVSEVRR
ncbi:MAG: hypothetical protein ACKOUS_12720 [Alphaproteobacteria bacterium]